MTLYIVRFSYEKGVPVFLLSNRTPAEWQTNSWEWKAEGMPDDVVMRHLKEGKIDFVDSANWTEK